MSRDEAYWKKPSPNCSVLKKGQPELSCLDPASCLGYARLFLGVSCSLSGGMFGRCVNSSKALVFRVIHWFGTG